MNGIANIVGPIVKSLVGLTILYFFYRQSLFNLRQRRKKKRKANFDVDNNKTIATFNTDGLKQLLA